MKDARELIWVDPERMSGAPCFRGTRVPVSTVFDNLADGLSLDTILEQWPTLDRQDVLDVLALAREAVIREAA